VQARRERGETGLGAQQVEQLVDRRRLARDRAVDAFPGQDDRAGQAASGTEGAQAGGQRVGSGQGCEPVEAAIWAGRASGAVMSAL